MNELRVREGEWNEALCFWTNLHPKTEIAAQFCRDHWNIWFISSRTFFVIRGNIQTQESAENLARHFAQDVLYRSRPVKIARTLS